MRRMEDGVNQGCALAPTLFGIFFALLLKRACGISTEGGCLHTRSEGRIFNLARLKPKTKVTVETIRYMLFADDTAVTSHTEQETSTPLGQIFPSTNSKSCTSSHTWDPPSTATCHSTPRSTSAFERLPQP